MSLYRNENNEEDVPGGDIRFDNAAFKAFFKKHYPSLCVYCKLKYGFNIHQAEDVVNSSFIKLWEARETLTQDILPKSYLYKIADNLSLNILRHERVKQEYANFLLRTTSEHISETSFNSIDFKQLSSAIDAVISDMPDQMRKILELRKNEGLKYAEIASRLDISVKTVDTQISRAMIKLREKLSGFVIFFIVLILSLFLKK